MASKIILGILLGILAGGAAKDIQNLKSIAGRFESPSVTESGINWLYASAAFSSLTALFFIIYTFIQYPFLYGFMAIGEVFFGAILAGFIGYPLLRIIGYLAAPLAIFFWIII